jgi:tRNA A-37 threonylcarbamoyl transferase component Bud32
VEDIVVYDYKKGEKVPIRPFMMEAFQKTFQEQEREQKRVRRRIVDVEKAVRRVEQQTWDKPGAIEDMGSPD